MRNSFTKQYDFPSCWQTLEIMYIQYSNTLESVMPLKFEFHFQDNLTDHVSDPEDPDLHRPGDSHLPRSQHPQVHGGGGEPGREWNL